VTLAQRNQARSQGQRNLSVSDILPDGVGIQVVIVFGILQYHKPYHVSYGLLPKGGVDGPFGSTSSKFPCRGIMKITSHTYTAQNEWGILQNLNEIDDDDGNKKIQLSWCPGNQIK